MHGCASKSHVRRLRVAGENRCGRVAAFVCTLARSVAEISVLSFDSYDNAMAESVIGLFKSEVIYRQGPWKSIESVEYATLEWVDWFNNRRLLEPIGYVPPAEFEQAFYDEVEAPAEVAGLT